MSLVVVIWSVVATSALVLAIMYGLAWLMDRRAGARLAFAFEALSIVATVIVELGMMHSTTAEHWGEWVRWSQVPIFMRTVGVVAFVRLYFDAGRNWLLWSCIASRAFVLVAGFLIDPNFNFAQIDSIKQIPFLGERITVVGQAVVSSHQWFATLTTYLVLVFVTDASITLWRRGSPDARRKVIVIGGAVFLAWALAGSMAQLMIYGIVQMPTLLSPPGLIVFAAMTFEMSRETLRASRLSLALKESEARLRLAASAPGFGLCVWDARKQRLWATRAVREMFGLDDHDPLELDLLLRKLHPDDAEPMRLALRDVTTGEDEYEVHFRILQPDGNVRRTAALCRSELDDRGRVSLIRGVLRDVTEQFSTRQEIEQLRRELAHFGRVSMLGTMSSSLAHELSQPLSAILLNSRTANLILEQPEPDLGELRQIVEDIQQDDRHAIDVIDGLRSLLRRRNLEFAPVSVEGLLRETYTLLKSDAEARSVKLECGGGAGMPVIQGDKVHLSQVLINLVINAMDAVADNPAGHRLVSVRAYSVDPNWVELEIEDSGNGIPADAKERIFDSFYTTKATGLGMGLSVSRTIVEAHAGRIWAVNSADGGAVFHVRLPTAAQ